MMQSDLRNLESTSLFYYVPPPAGQHHLLYYPISAGFFDCKPGCSMARSYDSSYLLIVMLTGKMSYETPRSRGVAQAGQALLLDCSLPYSYAAQGKCSFTFVHFDGAQSRELVEEIERRSGSLVRLTYPNNLHEAIGEMLIGLRSGQPMSQSQYAVVLYDMLMQLLEAGGISGNPMVDKAIEYIQSGLTGEITVEDVATHVGYSPSYFSHIFTEETGLSPYQFVVRSRVERAQQLLKMTNLSIQDVAFQTGFNSVANFCYTFRRATGLSPSAYRKNPPKDERVLSL